VISKSVPEAKSKIKIMAPVIEEEIPVIKKCYTQSSILSHLSF
jgi:hypothetical protein